MKLFLQKISVATLGIDDIIEERGGERARLWLPPPPCPHVTPLWGGTLFLARILRRRWWRFKLNGRKKKLVRGRYHLAIFSKCCERDCVCLFGGTRRAKRVKVHFFCLTSSIWKSDSTFWTIFSAQILHVMWKQEQTKFDDLRRGITKDWQRLAKF